MSAPSLIRKSLAGFLLVVFAFGITPKRTLHNLVANHKDGKVASVHSEAAALSKASFNCQIDNLISESPFVSEKIVLVQTPVPFAADHTVLQLPCFHSSEDYSFGLRGPPML